MLSGDLNGCKRRQMAVLELREMSVLVSRLLFVLVLCLFIHGAAWLEMARRNAELRAQLIAKEKEASLAAHIDPVTIKGAEGWVAARRSG